MGARGFAAVAISMSLPAPVERGTGASIGWDHAGWFVRLARDPKAEFTSATMTRVSVGMRFQRPCDFRAPAALRGPARAAHTRPMIKFKCLVNGEIDAATRARVRDGLDAAYRRHLALDAPLQVEFTEVRRGLWFTAGRPSEASMVLGSVPAGTPQPVRVALMDDVARMFSDATGTRYEDVMVVAADARP